MEYFRKSLKKAFEIKKKKAIKEFAEKLKTLITITLYSRDRYIDYEDTMYIIDELLKEYSANV